MTQDLRRMALANGMLREVPPPPPPKPEATNPEHVPAPKPQTDN